MFGPKSTQGLPLWKHDIVVVTASKIATFYIDQQSTQGVPLWKHDIVVVQVR